MKVILCEDVDDLGEMGSTVNVAPGYARNFLLPRRLAVPVESGNAKQVEHELRAIRRREEKLRSERQEHAKGLGDLTIEITARSGEGGKLFGSVTSLHIAEKLKEMGHEVNRKRIRLSEPLKSIGEHMVPINLGTEVTAELKVVISAEAMEGAAPEAVEDEGGSIAEGDEDTQDAASGETDGDAVATEATDEGAEEPAETEAAEE